MITRDHTEEAQRVISAAERVTQLYRPPAAAWVCQELRELQTAIDAYRSSLNTRLAVLKPGAVVRNDFDREFVVVCVHPDTRTLFVEWQHGDRNQYSRTSTLHFSRVRAIISEPM